MLCCRDNIQAQKGLGVKCLSAIDSIACFYRELSSKQPRVMLRAGAKVVLEFYDLDTVWPAESLERLRLMRAKAQQT